MSEYLLLTKTLFRNFLFKTGNSKKKKGLKIGTAFITFIALFVLSIYYSWLYMDMFSALKNSFFPYFMCYLSFAMTFMFSITSSQGMLFGFTDLDMLRSFPLKEDNIVASKVTLFVLYEYLTSGLFLIPALIVFGYRAGFGFMYYLWMVIGFISFPIIPMLLASVIGVFIKYISAGKKYANLIQNAGTILFILLIYVLSFSSGYAAGSSEEATITAEFANYSFFRYLYPCNWYIDAMTQNKFVYLLLLTVLAFALLYVAIKFYAKNLIRINEKAAQGYHNKNFKLSKNKKDKSTFGALFSKELRRVLANFTYMLNTTIGMFMLLAMSIYLCFFVSGEIKSMISSIHFMGDKINTIIWQGVILVIFMMSQMTCTTGVSISLEGKSMWLLKTLPLNVRDIFLSKILVNILFIIIPCSITLLMVGITFQFPIQYYLFGIVFIILTAIFVACLGLTINLLFPKLDYDREAAVIKQSLSAFLATFIPFLLGVGLLVLFFFFLDKANLFYIYIILYIILDILLIAYLYTKGANRFLYEIN